MATKETTAADVAPTEDTKAPAAPAFIRFRRHVIVAALGLEAWGNEVAQNPDAQALASLSPEWWEAIDEARYQKDAIRFGRATQFERRVV